MSSESDSFIKVAKKAIVEFLDTDEKVRSLALDIARKTPGSYFKVIKRMASFSRDPDPLLSMMLALGTRYSMLMHKSYLKNLTEEEQELYIMRKFAQRGHRMEPVEDTRKDSWVRCERSFVQHYILKQLDNKEYMGNFEDDSRRLLYHSCNYDVARYMEIDFKDTISFRTEVPTTSRINTKPQALFNDTGVFNDLITAILEPTESSKDMSLQLEETKKALERDGLLEAFHKVPVIKQGNILQHALTPQKKDIPYFDIPRSLINCSQGIKNIHWAVTCNLAHVLDIRESTLAVTGIGGNEKIREMCRTICRLMMVAWSGLPNSTVQTLIGSLQITTTSKDKNRTELTPIKSALQESSLEDSEETIIVKSVFGMPVQDIVKLPNGSSVYPGKRSSNFSFVAVENEAYRFKSYVRKGIEDFCLKRGAFIANVRSVDNHILEMQCNFSDSRDFLGALTDIAYYIDWNMSLFLKTASSTMEARENQVHSLRGGYEAIFAYSFPEGYMKSIIKGLTSAAKKSVVHKPIKVLGRDSPVHYHQSMSIPPTVDKRFVVESYSNNIKLFEISDQSQPVRLYRLVGKVKVYFDKAVTSNDPLVYQYLHPRAGLKKCLEHVLKEFSYYWRRDINESMGEFNVMKSYILGDNAKKISNTLGSIALQIKSSVQNIAKRKRSRIEAEMTLRHLKVDQMKWALFVIFGTLGGDTIDFEGFRLEGDVSISLKFNSGILRRELVDSLGIDSQGDYKTEVITKYYYDGEEMKYSSSSSANGGVKYVLTIYKGHVGNKTIYINIEDLPRVGENDLFYSNDKYFRVRPSLTKDEENEIALNKVRYVIRN